MEIASTDLVDTHSSKDKRREKDKGHHDIDDVSFGRDDRDVSNKSRRLSSDRKKSRKV
jgi:hypothetical protein